MARLSRFVGTTLIDPVALGGGSEQARDGFDATPEVVNWLNWLAAEVLAVTPAFVTRVIAAAGPTVTPQTFPPGLYGPEEPEDTRSEGLGLAGRFSFPTCRRA
ncbi:MAG: hypothetical protein ABI808_11705 [Pseudonocardiales bacterium]